MAWLNDAIWFPVDRNSRNKSSVYACARGCDYQALKLLGPYARIISFNCDADGHGKVRYTNGAVDYEIHFSNTDEYGFEIIGGVWVKHEL